MQKNIIYLIAIVSVLLVNCKHDADHEHRNEHSEAPETETRTAYSKDFELFVDFQPLIVGQNITFAAHITELNSYAPVTSGSLTISLIGQKGIRATAEAPEEPGIFTPTLKPIEAGMHKLLFEYTSENGNATFEINKFEVFADEHEALHHEHEEEEGNDVKFSKEQAWKTDFMVEKINPSVFKEVIQTSGQILPANGDEQIVVAPFNGIISLGRKVFPGVNITKGNTVASLSGKGLATDNIATHFNQIKTNYEKAKNDFERIESLYQEKIVSQVAYNEAKVTYEQAKVAYENVSKPEEDATSAIRSPLSGYIKTILVKDGEFVQAGTPLMVVTENKNLILQADVSQSHWHCLPEINEANFRAPSSDEVYNTKAMKGRLISYGKNAVNASWTTPVFFELPNTKNLVPGSYVEVHLLSKPHENMLFVPLSALIEEQGNYYVFIQKDGESYEKRAIKTGVENGFAITVTAGLEPGERVVTLGAYQVKLASMSASLPAHNHSH